MVTIVTAAKVGVVTTASVFISLVTDIISLISDVIFPVANVIFSVVNVIPSASDVISPVMPLKMISGFETVISSLDIIVADTEITIHALQLS